MSSLDFAGWILVALAFAAVYFLWGIEERLKAVQRGVIEILEILRTGKSTA